MLVAGKNKICHQCSLESFEAKYIKHFAVEVLYYIYMYQYNMTACELQVILKMSMLEFKFHGHIAVLSTATSLETVLTV